MSMFKKTDIEDWTKDLKLHINNNIKFTNRVKLDESFTYIPFLSCVDIHEKRYPQIPVDDTFHKLYFYVEEFDINRIDDLLEQLLITLIINTN